LAKRSEHLQVENAQTQKANCRECKKPIVRGNPKLLIINEYAGNKSICGDCAIPLLRGFIAELSVGKEELPPQPPEPENDGKEKQRALHIT